MANKDYKAFIVEGEAREPQVIDNISKVFFKHGNFKIITLPAGENIYMLWKKLKEDDFDTDIMDCFWCEIVNGDLVLKEHEAAKWLDKSNLNSVEWLPADITIIEKIRKGL